MTETIATIIVIALSAINGGALGWLVGSIKQQLS